MNERSFIVKFSPVATVDSDRQANKLNLFDHVSNVLPAFGCRPGSNNVSARKLLSGYRYS